MLFTSNKHGILRLVAYIQCSVANHVRDSGFLDTPLVSLLKASHPNSGDGRQTGAGRF
jgi:hypothetical protein